MKFLLAVIVLIASVYALGLGGTGIVIAGPHIDSFWERWNNDFKARFGHDIGVDLSPAPPTHAEAAPAAPAGQNRQVQTSSGLSEFCPDGARRPAVEDVYPGFVDGIGDTLITRHHDCSYSWPAPAARVAQAPAPVARVTNAAAPTGSCDSQRETHTPNGAWHPAGAWRIVNFWSNQPGVDQSERKLLLAPGENPGLLGGGTSWSWPASCESVVRGEFAQNGHSPITLDQLRGQGLLR